MTVQQLTEDDLKGMSPEAIVAAHSEGRLDALLGRPSRAEPDDGQVSAEEIVRLTPEQITAAFGAGRLDTLLGREGTA